MKVKSFSYVFSSVTISTIILSTPLTLVASSVNNPVMAQSGQINLLSQGKGTFSLGNGGSRNVTSVSAIIQGVKIQITLFFNNGQTINFDGNFSRQTPTQGRVNLSNSGMANASGTLLLEYRKDNSISVLNGQGNLDGQNFRLNFKSNQQGSSNNNNQNRLNLQQSGEGLFSLQSRPNRNITSVFVSVEPNKNAKVTLFFKDGNSFSFDGKQNQRDAYSIRINITRSGMADATGFFTIELGAGKTITNLVGQGTLDGQSFLANFR
jgi:hypothetical protein